MSEVELQISNALYSIMRLSYRPHYAPCPFVCSSASYGLLPLNDSFTLGSSINDATCSFKEKFPLPFRHVSSRCYGPPQIWRHNLLTPFPCSLQRSLQIYISFKHNAIFCIIWHICNSKHHSISKFWYVEMISWIVAVSSTTPWSGLAADVTCVTSHNLSTFSSTSQYRKLPSSPRRVRTLINDRHQQTD